MVEVISRVNEDWTSFDFDKSINQICSVIPKKHLLYLESIEIYEASVSNRKHDEEAIAYYLFEEKSGRIFINISCLIKKKIPLYLFDHYQEIASLYLSEIVGHEVGHHVIRFWKHAIKKREMYANNYGRTCYLKYFVSRKKKILTTLFWGSINIIDLNRDQRLGFRNSRKELIDWYNSKETEHFLF